MHKTYWQIAAGFHGRDYSEEFLRFGIAFVGGDEQRATMAEIKPGDVVVLKWGVKQIAAVGDVVARNGVCRGDGDKEWLHDFDGWDLPAYCYVNWRVPHRPRDTEGLRRGTICRIHKSAALAEADAILTLPPIMPQPEPKPTKLVDDDEILDFLIREGLRPGAADDLTNTLRRIRLLANYYNMHFDRDIIKEHETRTFLIIPLLLALGWAEQQLKIEFSTCFGSIDIACFARPYHRKNNECVALIESKSFSSGLHYAPEQVREYAKAFQTCQVLVVSNGYCYKTYKRLPGNEGFSKTPSAYMNLLKPRKRYPLDPVNVKGVFDVLRTLLPISIR